ncbi:hypothetical protein KCU92_g156, partial [Aureobasidium melanogenum]
MALERHLAIEQELMHCTSRDKAGQLALVRAACHKKELSGRKRRACGRCRLRAAASGVISRPSHTTRCTLDQGGYIITSTAPLALS